MTQVIQYDKNPSAEGAAVRVARASATPTVATDVFTSWPPLGTKSHKLVATAVTVASVGLPNADRPAAASGQQWSVSARLRSSQARTVELALVFYNTAGATLGSALLTVPVSAAFTAGEIKTLQVNGATAPATTASVDVQVSRTVAGAPAISDTVHVDMVSLTRTATAVPYREPGSDAFATWSGTANASTQVYWTPAVTLTPASDWAPSPRMLVFVDDLPPGVATLTLFRTVKGRKAKVRGAIGSTVAGAFSIPDVETAFNVPSSYRAQMFSATGADLGYTAAAEATVVSAVCSVHNPLDPANAVAIDVADTSGNALTRPVNGERFYPEQRTLAVFVTGRRLGLQDVQLYFSTDVDQIAEKFESMLGGYGDDDQRVPVLCIRTPGFTDLPPVFYAGILKMTELPINVKIGGQVREWEASADEASPPFAGIVVALLTRDDIDAFFATRNARDAAYATRTAIDRDYSKAGTA